MKKDLKYYREKAEELIKSGQVKETESGIKYLKV
jgi:hypothetical protein